MKLVQKAKKFSVIERGEKRSSIKTHLKYRYRKTSEAHKIYKEEDNYEIKGWDYWLWSNDDYDVLNTNIIDNRVIDRIDSILSLLYVLEPHSFIYCRIWEQ